MEVSVLGRGFQPLIPEPTAHVSSSSTTVRLRHSLPVPAEPLSDPPSATFSPLSTAPRKHQPASYARRQSLILEFQKSSDLGSALSRSGGVLKTQDLNVILRHYGNLNRWHDLSQLFVWMQKHGKISVSSYSSYIKFIGQNFRPSKAIEIYNSIEDESIRNDVCVCNSVLSCLMKNGKFEGSINFFNQMKRKGVIPNAVTYSTLLTGCMKAKDGYTNALEMVREMEYNGLRMDSVIYGTLLGVCASNGRPEEAENYFQQMKEEGHTPNVFHYSSLLNAYSIDGNFRKADELFEEMKLAGLVPNKVILTTLLKVYVKGGLFEKSKELLSELEALGYAEDEMPYCLLMDALAKDGHLREAESIFVEMKRKHVKSDGYAHSIMISAFCQGNLFDEAKQLAKDYEARSDKFDLVMLNTMLCTFCRTGEMENVMQIMRKMDELAISPDGKTFEILVKYFCKEKLYLLAYRAMDDMHNKGYLPEEHLCSSLIFHLGNTGAHLEAFFVYNMLRYGKRTISTDFHEKILHILVAGGLLKDAYVVVKDNAALISRPAIKKFAIAFAKFGNVNLINDVYKVLHRSGYRIDQKLFRMVISRYIGLPEKKELLLQLLDWMPGQGYIVDPSTRNRILRNSHLFGRQIVAEVLSRQRKILKALKSD